jgi:hypothetical protein
LGFQPLPTNSTSRAVPGYRGRNDHFPVRIRGGWVFGGHLDREELFPLGGHFIGIQFGFDLEDPYPVFPEDRLKLGQKVALDVPLQILLVLELPGTQGQSVKLLELVFVIQDNTRCGR